MGEDPAAEFWNAYRVAGGPDAAHSAWWFGADDDPAMQTRLAELVLHGPKRATAGVLADYTAGGEALPRPGDFSVILDGDGRPRCIIETTHVEVRPFGEVDEDFAWTEGEGDRTLEWWRRAHRDYFARQGLAVDDDTPMVLERFDLVWPPPAGPADASS